MKRYVVLAMAVVMMLATQVHASFITKMIPSFGEHHKRNHHSSEWHGQEFDFTPFMHHYPEPKPPVDEPIVLFPIDPGYGGGLCPITPPPNQPVPEPSTFVLLGLGILGLARYKLKK